MGFIADKANICVLNDLEPRFDADVGSSEFTAVVSIPHYSVVTIADVE